MSRGANRTVDLSAVRRLVDLDDVALGVTLLRGMPTNEGRSIDVLEQISSRAQEFGRALALRDSGGSAAAGMTVVERSEALDPLDPVIARFLHKSRTIELNTSTVDFCENLVQTLEWIDVFPSGSVRRAAIEHERAHDLIAHSHARDLRIAVGQLAFSLGRWRRWAHIAGADELAAHAFAQHTLGLGRSPLLITAAAMAALDAGHRPSKES